MLAPMRLLRTLIIIAAFAIGAGPRLLIIRVLGPRGRFLAALGSSTARLAEHIGPTAIKVTQIISARRDLMPAEFLGPLGRIRAHVRQPHRRAVRRVLEQAYELQLTKVFAEISEQPIAAGSVAVMLRARLIDGQEVAVKVLRPAVERKLRTDMRWLRWFARIAARHPKLRGIPVLDTFDLISSIMVAQCDMLAEADRAIRISSASENEIIVPRPRKDLSRRTVLVMEYIPAFKYITDLDLPTHIYEKSCLILLRQLYRMIFVEGVIHCDLHPGNVGVSEDGRVILYDFGLVANLTDRDRQHFRQLFIAIAYNDPRAAARCIAESAQFRPDDLDESALQRDVREILQRRSGQRAGEFLVLGFVDELFDVQRRHRIGGAPGFANAIWALGTFEGLVRDRFPHLDFQAEARPFVIGGRSR